MLLLMLLPLLLVPPMQGATTTTAASTTINEAIFGTLYCRVYYGCGMQRLHDVLCELLNSYSTDDAVGHDE